jgi:hypothetical protein
MKRFAPKSIQLVERGHKPEGPGFNQAERAATISVFSTLPQAGVKPAGRSD